MKVWYPWTMFNTAQSFVNFFQFFCKKSPLTGKGSLGEIFTENRFFIILCSLGYYCIDRTGIGYREEGKFKFWLTSSVARSVVALMIAKKIASPPTFILLEEEAPSKRLIIVQIIWLFVVNNVEKLPGFLFGFNTFCDLFIKFFPKQTFWSVFLNYAFIFQHHVFHLLFITQYCHHDISTSIIRQRIKCLFYHDDRHLYDVATVLCCCKHFSNIFWNICSWAVFFWPSRKSHICDRGLKIFPIFSPIEQKALSNDKVSLAFFFNRRNFIFEYICFFQVRFSGIGNYCNTMFVTLCQYQVWNSSLVIKHRESWINFVFFLSYQISHQFLF